MTYYEIPWRHQDKQISFLHALGIDDLLKPGGVARPPVADVVGYGGAAGGGKTDALLMAGFLCCVHWPGCGTVLFRRKYTELEGTGGAIERSKQLFNQVAAYNEGQHLWKFGNGSTFRFRHCQREGDVHDYQSQQIDVLLIDEATHFTEYQVRYLITRNRATVDGLIPLCAMATNPGGVGHLWFKSTFVDIGEPGRVHVAQVEGEDESRMFIPALLGDNQALVERDPGYRRRLAAQSLDLQRALLYGDWDVFAGQVLSEWRRHLHVVEPHPIPDHWIRWRGVDWGYREPWCALWLARDPDTDYAVVYRESYKAGLTDPEQADEINRKTASGEKISRSLADPSMWTKRTTGEKVLSTAEVYGRAGIPLTKADNSRIIGLNRVREALKEKVDVTYEVEDGEGTRTVREVRPKLQVWSTCHNLIRTLPALVYSETYVEDVDDEGEDHAYDALRYAMSWKSVKSRARAQPPRGGDKWSAARVN